MSGPTPLAVEIAPQEPQEPQNQAQNGDDSQCRVCSCLARASKRALRALCGLVTCLLLLAVVLVVVFWPRRIDICVLADEIQPVAKPVQNMTNGGVMVGMEVPIEVRSANLYSLSFDKLEARLYFKDLHDTPVAEADLSDVHLAAMSTSAFAVAGDAILAPNNAPGLFGLYTDADNCGVNPVAWPGETWLADLKVDVIYQGLAIDPIWIYDVPMPCPVAGVIPPPLFKFKTDDDDKDDECGGEGERGHVCVSLLCGVSDLLCEKLNEDCGVTANAGGGSNSSSSDGSGGSGGSLNPAGLVPNSAVSRL